MAVEPAIDGLHNMKKIQKVKVSSEALRSSEEDNCSINKNREFSRRHKFNSWKMVSVSQPKWCLSARWASGRNIQQEKINTGWSSGETMEVRDSDVELFV